MKRPAVFIATTSGPVQIERIIRERAPLSLMMLGRGSKSLPVSPDYDDFVRPPSGPIERFFGPFDDGGFRLELSAPVDAGESWQLAVFVSHAVQAADQLALARDLDEADSVIWLTGTVDYDGRVGRVGHIEDKLHSATTALGDWQRRGLPVVLAVPAGDDDAGLAATAAQHGARAVGVSDALRLCRDLGLMPAEPTADTAGRRRRARRLPDAVVLAAMAGLVSLAVAAAWLLLPREPGDLAVASVEREKTGDAAPILLQPPATQTPAAAPSTATAGTAMAPAPVTASIGRPPVVRIFERRAPAGSDCLNVHFGDAVPELIPVALGPGGEAAPSRSAGLCGLRFVIELGDAARYLRARLQIEQGRIAGPATPPEALSGATAVRGRQRWDIDLPVRRFDGLRYRLQLSIGEAPLTAARRPAPADNIELSLSHAVTG